MVVVARLSLTESDVEDATLTWLEDLGWQISHGPDILSAERADYSEVMLERCLDDSLPLRVLELTDPTDKAACGPEGNVCPG